MNRFGKPPERIRREKKLILLISEKNPLFGEIAALERVAGYSFAAIREAEASEQAKREEVRLEGRGKLSPRHQVLGISGETLRKWSRWVIAEGADDKKPLQAVHDGLVAMGNFIRATQNSGMARTALGGPIDANDATQSLDKLKVLLDRLTTFRLDYEEESQTTAVYSTAKQLGIPIADAQCVIDTAVYSESPLLVQPYRDRREADKDFGLVAGIYKALLHRRVRDVDAWLQGALHVRYVLATDNRYVLRVKLNFPVLYAGMAARKLAKPGQEGKQHPWEYDGFVDVRSKLNWVLEKRDDYRPDYVYFITSHRSNHLIDNKLRAVGQYLTSHQDDDQTVVAGPVILEYVGSTISPAPGPGRRLTENEATDFMWTTPDTFMLNDENKEKREEYGRLRELAQRVGLRPA